MASMGFNPFARHTESQPSKPNDQGKSAPVSTTETEPQTTVAVNTAQTEEKPPARPTEKKRPPAVRISKAVNPFACHEGKKQFRRTRKEGPPPAQRLLDWLRDWPHPIVGIRDLCNYGPGPLRNRKQLIELAEILVGHGWLAPVEACRRDTKWWRLVRGPSGYPTMMGVAVNVAAVNAAATNVATIDTA